MSDSSLSPEEIRAAAEVHRELGPEYSDAVVASFLEKVDREIAARVEARLAGTRRAEPAKAGNRRALLTGMVIGAAVSGIPVVLLLMTRASHVAQATVRAAPAGGGNVTQVVSRGPASFGWLLFLFIAVAICAAGVTLARQKQRGGQPR